MRETFFILLVLFVLVALTAVRYRKQIATLIGVSRMLRDARSAAGAAREPGEKQVTNKGQLVNCAKCGTWAPKATSIKFDGGIYYCSKGCLEKASRAV